MITKKDRLDAYRDSVKKLKRRQRQCSYCGNVYKHKKYYTARLCPEHQETLRKALRERYLIRIQVDSNNLLVDLPKSRYTGRTRNVV